MNIKALGIAGVAASLMISSASGHHSFAMFDNSRTDRLGGTVTEFEWLNPHVWLHVSVAYEDGTEQVWSFEAGSTRQLSQSYWDANSVRPGDVLSDVGFHPLKDGSNGGQLLEVTKADGTYLCQGPDCRERQRLEREAEAAEEARANNPVPSFAGLWQRDDPYMQFMPPRSGQGPLRENPQYARELFGELSRPFVADTTDPLLKPWAAAVVEDLNTRRVVNEEVILPAHSLCWPSGVPGSLRMREPVQFLQAADVVTIAYQRDHQVRRIHLNDAHSADVPMSWYGESVGHYEGDTLVVDTIGLNDETVVDWYGTPHTENLHVVERYRIVDGGNTLEVHFTVTDPGTFTVPWSAVVAVVHYRNLGENAQFNEIVCAENNKDASTGRDYPVPMGDLTAVEF
jgi:hypothetical protein